MTLIVGCGQFQKLDAVVNQGFIQVRGSAEAGGKFGCKSASSSGRESVCIGRNDLANSGLGSEDDLLSGQWGQSRIACEWLWNVTDDQSGSREFSGDQLAQFQDRSESAGRLIGGGSAAELEDQDWGFAFIGFLAYVSHCG